MIGLDWELRDNIAVFENSSLILLIKLHLHQNGNLRAWIGQDKIMKATGLSRPTVTAAVNHLEKIGALVKVPGKFREDEEKGLPSRLTIYQLTGLFFDKDKPIHYLHFGTPEYEMTILTRVIAILEYQAEHTKDEAKRKECFTLKGKFLNHKDSFPKGITGTTLEGSTGKSLSGASAPTVAHEGQSDGVGGDEAWRKEYERYELATHVSDPNREVLPYAQWVARKKNTTPDAGKATPANGARAEPVPDGKRLDDEPVKKPRSTKQQRRDNLEEALKEHAPIAQAANMAAPTISLIRSIISDLITENIWPEDIPGLYAHVARIAREGTWHKWTLGAVPKYSADYRASKVLAKTVTSSQSATPAHIPPEITPEQQAEKLKQVREFNARRHDIK